MTTYQAGELLVVSFPFTSAQSAKNRPALVLLDTGDADIVIARLTSKPPKVAFDIAIVDWKGAGLRSPATIRVHKLFTVEKSQVHFSIGHLQPADRLAVSTLLRQTFGKR
jgi:PemK-like, MazF-like toxin of type II toxin-antitoxin system